MNSMEIEEITIKAEPMEFGVDDVEQWIEQTVVRKTEVDESSGVFKASSTVKRKTETFRVVEERSGFITVNAADLKSDDERVFVERLKQGKTQIENSMLEQQHRQQIRSSMPNINNTVMMVTCSKCNQTFDNHRTFFVHSESGKCQVIGDKLSCSICPMTFGEQHEFESHLRKHGKNLIFCNRHCGASFKSLVECEEHEMREHNVRNLKCYICMHKFRAYSFLVEHRQLHRTLLHVVCSLCRGWFASKEALHNHWLVASTTCGELAVIALQDVEKNKCSAVQEGGSVSNAASNRVEKKRSRKQHHVQRKIIDDEDQEMASLTLSTLLPLVAGVKKEPLDEPLSSQIPLDIVIKKEPIDEDMKQDICSIDTQKDVKMERKISLVGGLVDDSAGNLQLVGFPNLKVSRLPLVSKPTNSNSHLVSAPISPVMVNIPNTVENNLKLPPPLSLPGVQILKLPKNTNIVRINGPLRAPLSVSTVAKPKATSSADVSANKRPVVIKLCRMTAQSTLIPPLTPVTPTVAATPISMALQRFAANTKVNVTESVTIGQSLLKPIIETGSSPEVNTSTLPPLQALSGGNTTPPHTILKMNVLKSVDSSKMTQHDFQKMVVETVVGQKNGLINGNERKLCFVPKDVLRSIELLPGKQQVIKSMLQQIKQATDNTVKNVADSINSNDKIGTVACNAVRLIETQKVTVLSPTVVRLAGTAPLSVPTLPLATVLGLEPLDSLSEEKESSLKKINTVATLSTSAIKTSTDEYGGRIDTNTTVNALTSPSTSEKSSGRQRFDCSKCGRSLSTKLMLQDHMRANCSRERLYQCSECPKRFFSSNTLRTHMSIHTGELPFKCNSCEARFRTRGQVNVHNRRHTGERPFVCQVCSQSFTHRETLISHLSRHIGMKRYKCYACDKRFSCVSGLKMHRENRPTTCGKVKLNSRAIGPRVRVVRGNVFFEPQPEINPYLRWQDPEVLSEIQNTSNNNNSNQNSSNNNSMANTHTNNVGDSLIVGGNDENEKN